MFKTIVNLFAGRPKEALADNDLRRFAMSLGAMYIDVKSSLDDIADDMSDVNIKSSGYTDKLIKEMEGHFFRLDMDYGPNYSDHCKKLLEEMWEVTDKVSLIKMVDFLFDKGHRLYYDCLCRFIKNHSGEIKDPELSSLADELKLLIFDPTELPDLDLIHAQIEFIRNNPNKLLSLNIIGWDVARIIHILRLSYLAKYISHEEAWGYVDKTVDFARKDLHSWQEFSDSFLVGRSFWSALEKEMGEFEQINKILLNNKYSPWNVVKW